MKHGFKTVKPGQKLCKRCHIAANSYEDIEENAEDLDADVDMVDLEDSIHQEEIKSKVSEQLESLEQSPLVLHSKKRPQKVEAVKAKVMKVTCSLASDMAAIYIWFS